jgi:polysaccharide biosynthesis protein PslJ
VVVLSVSGGATVGAVSRTVAIAAALLMAQVATGLVVAGGGRTALAVIVLLAAVPALAVAPLSVAALAFPLVFATRRLGLGGLDLSYADAALVATTVVAMRWVPWSSQVLRRLFLVLMGYLAVMAVVVAGTPTTRAVLEWLHRAELVGGSLIVGAAVAASGRARQALRLYVATAFVYAVTAVVDTVTSGFEPAYPFGTQKNGAGFFIAAAIIMTLRAPGVLALGTQWMVPLRVVLFAGLVATQSRSASIAVGVVLVFLTLRGRVRFSFVPVLGVMGIVAMVWLSRDVVSRDDQFNSLNSRLSTYEIALEVWQVEPVFGAGLRYWRDPQLGAGEPHNFALSALGESGVVGLVAVVALNGAFLITLRRRPDELAACAKALIVARLVVGLADVYWVAGPGTISWLVVGLAAGVTAAMPARPSPFGRHPELAVVAARP